MAPKKTAPSSAALATFLQRALFLGALFFSLGGCTHQRGAVNTTPSTPRSFAPSRPGPSATPIVRTHRINQRDLLYRVYNTSEEPFRALLIFIRGASCEGNAAKRIWMRMSTSPLHPNSAQTFRYAVPVNCNNIHVKAVAIQPGQYGRPHASKRFPWLQWRVATFQAPFVRLTVYNSSPEHAVVFGLNVIGFLCATKKISMQRFYFRKPLYPGQSVMQNIRMREICEDVRIQVLPIGVMRRPNPHHTSPRQPKPQQPITPHSPNTPGEI